MKGQKAVFFLKTKVGRKNNISYTIMTHKSKLRGELSVEKADKQNLAHFQPQLSHRVSSIQGTMYVTLT